MTRTGLLGRLRDTHAVATWRIAITGFIGVCLFQLCGLVGVRINASPSLPVGLYLASGDSGAALVEFCPVEPFASFALARGYRDRGTCPDGGTPLLKPVIARAGDLVEISALGIAVNGRLLARTAPLPTDTHGRPLTSWPYGHYVVSPEAIWVASSYSERSFDSRYFGPVATSAIRNHVLPLVTLR